jgi:Kef-type K+ transport system membrane component KefB
MTSVTGFGFDTLALVMVIGLAGPLLASVPRLRVPVVVGELFAGLLFGRTGFGILDPDDPMFKLLANIGFALVMFVVGTHVPIADSTLRTSVKGAVARVVLVAAVATCLAVGVAAVFHTGHAALYTVLMASSSAALALPVIQSMDLSGPSVLGVTAQIAIADSVCIILLPLVIDPNRAVTAAIGAVAIAVSAYLLFRLLSVLDRKGIRRRWHRQSHKLRFALELRVSLIALFALCALAIATHVSIMLAGFALGLAMKAAGEPHRLARQLFGVSEGFFGPLFFVWLGASLYVRELADHPSYVLLGVCLGVGAVLAHCAGRIVGQPLTLGALAAAQLGIPVAAATLGTEQALLPKGEPAALILGALLTVAVTSVAAARARRKAQQHAGTGVSGG